MRVVSLCLLICAGLISTAGYAAAPASAPAGTTGLCKDGSYWSGPTKKGACKGHKGVKEWYRSEAAPKAAAPTKPEAPKVAAGGAGVPASAPAGTTGLCKDGSYWSGPTKKGACKGHKGVKEWYGAAATPAAPSTSAAPAAPKAAATTKPEAPRVVAAPGGGAGKVWVNTDSKVYHCAGDRWYGKTKKGEYMSEAEATAQGFKADHGKACK